MPQGDQIRHPCNPPYRKKPAKLTLHATIPACWKRDIFQNPSRVVRTERQRVFVQKFIVLLRKTFAINCSIRSAGTTPSPHAGQLANIETTDRGMVSLLLNVGPDGVERQQQGNVGGEAEVFQM